jgi:hypothetical protein
MRLRIRRLGGIAGVTLKTHVDTGELPAESGSEIDATFRELASRAPAGPPQPDAFRYEITQLDDPNEASVLLDERQVPPQLSGLIDAVNEAGEIERRGSSAAD